MAERYSETALDHFQNPRNVGRFDHPDAIGQATNPATGAVMEIHLKVDASRDVEARFSAQGCTATIAAGSMLTEMLPGRSVEDLRITTEEVDDALGGLPPTRRHAARLAADAMSSAVRAMGPKLPAG